MKHSESLTAIRWTEKFCFAIVMDVINNILVFYLLFMHFLITLKLLTKIFKKFKNGIKKYAKKI